MRTSLYMVGLVVCTSFVGCGDKTMDRESTIFDLEAAIDNRKKIDLYEMSESIDFVALDHSQTESLLCGIGNLEESKNMYYVHDDMVKVFNKDGKFISTIGILGRGHDEFMRLDGMAVDYDNEILYMLGTMGGGMINSVMAYDSSGNMVMRADSISGERMAFFDDRLIVEKGSPLSLFPEESLVGTKTPLIEVFSANLQREQVIETIDKGTGTIIIMESSGGNIQNISIIKTAVPFGVLSNNGNSLLVKEALGDTVYRYENRALKPAYIFDFGKYSAPSDAFGLNPTEILGNSHTIQNILESDRFLFVVANGKGVDIGLMVDKKYPSDSFSTVGADGTPGLFVDGIAFTPCYVRDNRLVGYIQALDIVDNAASITNPELAAVAATLKEDSNPVIVVATLKK